MPGSRSSHNVWPINIFIFNPSHAYLFAIHFPIPIAAMLGDDAQLLAFAYIFIWYHLIHDFCYVWSSPCPPGTKSDSLIKCHSAWGGVTHLITKTRIVHRDMTDFLNLRYCSSAGCELLFNQPVHVSFHAYTIILHVQRLYSRLTFAWVQLWRADAKTPISTLENIFYGPIELNFSSALRQTVRIRHPILKYIFGNQIICTIILTQRTHKFGYRITFNTRWIINSVPAGDAVACLLHPWNLFREFTLDERLAHQQPATAVAMPPLESFIHRKCRILRIRSKL